MKWFILGMMAMALVEWLWTRDWSADEPNTDYMTDVTLEDEYYADR